jgi:WXG100 family type VII secretion target
MAGQFDVSTDTMAQAQQRMTANVDDIRSELSALRGKLGALEGQWMGDGSTAFTGAHARYEAANQKLNQALDAISQSINQAHGNYLGTDGSAGQSLNAAGAAIPGF